MILKIQILRIYQRAITKFSELEPGHQYYLQVLQVVIICSQGCEPPCPQGEGMRLKDTYAMVCPFPRRGERKEYLKERGIRGRWRQFVQPPAPVGQRLQASDLTLFSSLSSSPWLLFPRGVLWPRRRLRVWDWRPSLLSLSLHPAFPGVSGSQRPLRLMLRAGAKHKPPVITPRVWPGRERQVCGDVLHRVDNGPGL